MADYHIIGGDGKEYGPYPPEKIRELLVENRLRATSQVRPEGGDWIALGEVPELVPPPVTQPTLQSNPPAPQGSYNPQAYVAPTGYTQQPPNNGLAVTGMILGISTWVLSCCCGFVPILGIFARFLSLATPIAGLICSLIARSQIKQSGGTQGGEGMALAGIITSALYLLLVLVGIILILLGVAAFTQFSRP